MDFADTRIVGPLDKVLDAIQEAFLVEPVLQKRRAMRSLLSAPKEILSRQRREQLMRHVLNSFGEDRQGYDMRLALMAKLTAEPTFYEVHISI